MATCRRILIKGLCKELVSELIRKKYPVGREAIYDYPYREVFLDRMNDAFIVFDTYLEDWTELDLGLNTSVEGHDYFLKCISEDYNTTVMMGYSQTTTGDTRFLVFENGQIRRSLYQKSYYDPHRILMETNIGARLKYEKDFEYPDLGENIQGYKFLDYYDDVQAMFEDYGYTGRQRQSCDERYLHIEYLNQKTWSQSDFDRWNNIEREENKNIKMTKQSIIDIIVEKLNKYPDIRYEKINDCELEIFKCDEKGFDILIQTSEREHTLHFETFHWHFDNDERETNEMLDQLILGLTGLARLKQFSKNGMAYKWTLQIRDREGNWFDNGTMGLINFNFWRKADIQYLQNDLLPKDLLFNE